MTPALQFLLALGTLIACARIGGALSKRLGQPAVLGELLAGVLLGPSLVNYFHLPWLTDEHLDDGIQHLAELGVIFLMFLAGLEINVSEMLKTGRAAALAGVGGVVATSLLGFGITWAFGLPPLTALFLSLALTATSVGISAQTLRELGALRRRESLTLLGAAVIDDILVLLLLSVFLALTGSAAGGVVNVIIRLAVYFIGLVGLGWFALPRLTHWIERRPISQGLMSFVIVTTLLTAWAAEAVGGIAALTGAFLAGLMFARTTARKEIEHNLATLTYGVCAPLFFVSIGLQANLRAVTGAGWLFSGLLILIVAASKILGGGLGARWGGLTASEALRLGIGMIARGEVVLIVASVGLSIGLIDSALFAQVVVVVLATTLLTPLLLRWVYAREERQEKEREKEKVAATKG